jgi:hypothetical protein
VLVMGKRQLQVLHFTMKGSRTFGAVFDNLAGAARTQRYLPCMGVDTIAACAGGAGGMGV